MSARKANSFDSQVSQIYEIRVKAYLDSSMVEWLGDFTIHHPAEAQTLLTGFLPDQSALFGILLRLHNLGIPLISVNPLPAPDDNKRAGEQMSEVPEEIESDEKD